MILDNPLICSCELAWFPNLLQDLKNRDDEMMQKKRPMCTMQNEHREYYVQNMPLERMSCIGKITNRAAILGAKTNFGVVTVVKLEYSLILITFLFYFYQY